MKLGLGALFMTVFTYIVFGEKYVKFGILHFIAFSSLLLFPIVGNKNVIKIILAIVLGLYFMNTVSPSLFNFVPPKAAFISGFYYNWGSIDHLYF